MRKKVKLIPPDLKRCQTMIRTGHALALGNPVREVRCNEKAKYILTEKEPADDGQCGSMSVCADCFKQAVKQLGLDYFTIKDISK